MDISNCNNYNVPINSIEYEIKKKKKLRNMFAIQQHIRSKDFLNEKLKKFVGSHIRTRNISLSPLFCS